MIVGPCDDKFCNVWVIPYTGKVLVGEKLVYSVNHELFAKHFLTNIHRHNENVFGICTEA